MQPKAVVIFRNWKANILIFFSWSLPKKEHQSLWRHCAHVTLHALLFLCSSPVLWCSLRLIYESSGSEKTLFKVKINKDRRRKLCFFFIIYKVIYLCLKAYKESLTRREKTVVWCIDFAPGFCIIRVTLLQCLKKLALIKSQRSNV